MYDFEVWLVNVKLMIEFKVDGMSSKLTYELDVDAMRLKCDSSPKLERSCFLNVLLRLSAKPMSLLTLSRMHDVDPDLHILPKQNVNEYLCHYRP